MARTLSSNLQTQIANDANKICFLVELNLSTILRLTNHYSDVTYDSNSYEAGGEFVNVATANETGELRVEEITLTLSNITSTVRSLIEGGDYIDKSANIYIAFFDDNETIVDATTFFAGTITHASITENEDMSHITLSIANQFSNWQLTKGRHFSDESQQQVYSGDKGLEYADQTKADIRWGSD